MDKENKVTPPLFIPRVSQGLTDRTNYARQLNWEKKKNLKEILFNCLDRGQGLHPKGRPNN